jgi:DNA-binding MurR/RpiR family transcriptional regulator
MCVNRKVTEITDLCDLGPAQAACFSPRQRLKACLPPRHSRTTAVTPVLTSALALADAFSPMAGRKKKVALLSLSARLNLLSPKRQQIIRPALEHPREFVLLSVRATAQRLKTDPATMVRIVRGMQFASYRQFQHYLHELSITYSTSLDSMQSSAGRRFTTPVQVRRCLEQDVKNLNLLIRNLDATQLAGLARRIYRARRIVLLGGDLATNLVKFLEHHLMILGLPVSSATSPAEVVHKMRFLGKKDMVIAATYRRGLRQTVEGMRQARANGAYCVGLTNTLASPISQFAHECYLTSVETTSFGDSYVAAMALLNVIVMACANYRRSRTLAVLKKVAQEERHGFRWYES